MSAAPSRVDRLGCAALLMADDGQQVAGIEMVGARLQDTAAQLLGFGEPAVALARGCAIQQLGQAQRVWFAAELVTATLLTGPTFPDSRRIPVFG